MGRTALETVLGGLAPEPEPGSERAELESRARAFAEAMARGDFERLTSGRPFRSALAVHDGDKAERYLEVPEMPFRCVLCVNTPGSHGNWTIGVLVGQGAKLAKSSVLTNEVGSAIRRESPGSAAWIRAAANYLGMKYGGMKDVEKEFLWKLIERGEEREKVQEAIARAAEAEKLGHEFDEAMAAIEEKRDG